eukprot:scaffold15432_cov101-Isochrysis_galbana.AAC.3
MYRSRRSSSPVPNASAAHTAATSAACALWNCTQRDRVWIDSCDCDSLASLSRNDASCSQPLAPIVGAAAGARELFCFSPRPPSFSCSVAPLPLSSTTDPGLPVCLSRSHLSRDSANYKYKTPPKEARYMGG